MSLAGDALQAGCENVAMVPALKVARETLCRSESMDEIKSIRDKAEAARALARNARLGLDIQNQAAELKLLAERKAGDLLSKLMLPGGDRRSNARPHSLSLAELGITRQQSSRWQRIAAISEADFRRYLFESQLHGQEITSAGLLRAASVSRAQAAEDAVPDESVDYEIFYCRDELSNQGDSDRPFRSLVSEVANHRDSLEQTIAPLLESSDQQSEPRRRLVRYYLGELRRSIGELDAALSEVQRNATCELAGPSANGPSSRMCSTALSIA